MAPSRQYTQAWPQPRYGFTVHRKGTGESPGTRFSADFADARGAQVHFVCVGTPQKRGEYAADLRYVEAAAESLLGVLQAGELVVGKSTVPVGTAARLAGLVADDLREGSDEKLDELLKLLPKLMK